MKVLVQGFLILILMGACSVALLKTLEHEVTGNDAANCVERAVGIRPTRPAHCDIMAMGDSATACRFDANPEQIAKLIDKRKLLRKHGVISVCNMLRSGPWYPDKYEGDIYKSDGDQDRIFTLLYDSSTLTAYFCSVTR